VAALVAGTLDQIPTKVETVTSSVDGTSSCPLSDYTFQTNSGVDKENIVIGFYTGNILFPDDSFSAATSLGIEWVTSNPDNCQIPVNGGDHCALMDGLFLTSGYQLEEDPGQSAVFYHKVGIIQANTSKTMSFNYETT